jgi:hypothetical protein
MAVGILAVQKGTVSKNTAATIYTCPAGVSQAVVHVNFSYNTSQPIGFARLRVNGVTVVNQVTQSGLTVNGVIARSLVLTPGDVIDVIQVDGTITLSDLRYSVIVSGYTVP